MKEKCVWVMQERWTMTDLIIVAVVAVMAVQMVMLARKLVRAPEDLMRVAAIEAVK